MAEEEIRSPVPPRIEIVWREARLPELLVRKEMEKKDIVRRIINYSLSGGIDISTLKAFAREIKEAEFTPSDKLNLETFLTLMSLIFPAGDLKDFLEKDEELRRLSERIKNSIEEIKYNRREVLQTIKDELAVSHEDTLFMELFNALEKASVDFQRRKDMREDEVNRTLSDQLRKLAGRLGILSGEEELKKALEDLYKKGEAKNILPLILHAELIDSASEALLIEPIYGIETESSDVRTYLLKNVPQIRSRAGVLTKQRVSKFYEGLRRIRDKIYKELLEKFIKEEYKI